MGDGQRLGLRRHLFDGGAFFVLDRKDLESDFVDKIDAKGDPNDVIAMSIRSIQAINRHGLRFATTHSLARRISKNILLLEFKDGRTAWRVAAYWAERTVGHESVAVVLEVFKGHSGKKGNIPQTHIRALEAKASIAEELVGKEREDGNC